MKKILIFIVTLALTAAFVCPSTLAAELHTDGNKVVVSGAVENGKLILAFYSKEMLVGVKLYQGVGTVEGDIASAPESAETLRAFYWDMETITPLSNIIVLPTEKTDEVNMMVKIGNKKFSATFYENETAEAFKAMLPLTLDMSELNGNEKYYYLTDNLPAKAERVGKINAGDIMLYGSSCVVLFYESFNTSYSYTKIGHIDDITGLKDAVGHGSVTVTFE